MRVGNAWNLYGTIEPDAVVMFLPVSHPDFNDIRTLHLSPEDDLPSVLSIIFEQKKQGCRRVAIVLQHGYKSFQCPTDFETLKRLCNNLSMQITFVIYDAPALSVLAYQYGFTIFHSFESYLQFLRQGDSWDAA